MSINNYQQVFIVKGLVWSDATRDYTKPYTSTAFQHKIDARSHATQRRVKAARIECIHTDFDKITYSDD